MAQHEAADEHNDSARPVTPVEIAIRAARQRKHAKQRSHAAEDRARAAEDRQAAAQDREQAARERLQDLAERAALERQLALTATDSLTGARTRTAGLSDLDRELDRCRRTGGLLVLTYVDVVGLKTVNDTNGHSAGDELLRRVIQVITAHLRSYDLIIRVGGDEFVCAMPNITMLQARRRFRAIATTLASAPDAAAITTGFAQPTAGENATELIARADNDLLARRRSNPDDPPQPI
ncbi:MAG: GGDEF domain-containing protein [Actinobacteria bacterium]|nr:GGDEF domain-containing protein [Actinomycetota bacterium]